MQLVEQWGRIEAGLDPSWSTARLALSLSGEAAAARAAALLGAATPGRSGRTVRFAAGRGGAGVGPEAVRRMLRRLDEEGIDGRLELVASEGAATAPAVERRTLVDAWDAELAVLPADWSDLYGQLVLRSSDDLDRGALLLSPINPRRYDAGSGYRFRCARRAGYGASVGMVRRCFERLDEEDIRGRLEILRVLSDTVHVQTQGPVWYVGGRVV